MKKLIAVAGLGAAIAIGSLVDAGTANATTSGYLASVADVSSAAAPSTQLKLGYATCDVLTAGRTGGLDPAATVAMVGKVFFDNGWTSKGAATVVVASITELCPSNYSYTMAGASDLADGGEL